MYFLLIYFGIFFNILFIETMIKQIIYKGSDQFSNMSSN